MPITTDDAQQILHENFADWVLSLDPSVHDIGPDFAGLSIPITPSIVRVGGVVSGQVMAALADTSMVIAASAFMGQFAPIATTNLDVSFLRPASGNKLSCTAQVVKGGRALIFAEAELNVFPSGKLVARASATFYRP